MLDIGSITNFSVQTYRNVVSRAHPVFLPPAPSLTLVWHEAPYLAPERSDGYSYKSSAPTDQNVVKDASVGPLLWGFNTNDTRVRSHSSYNNISLPETDWFPAAVCDRQIVNETGFNYGTSIYCSSTNAIRRVRARGVFAPFFMSGSRPTRHFIYMRADESLTFVDSIRAGIFRNGGSGQPYELQIQALGITVSSINLYTSNVNVIYELEFSQDGFVFSAISRIYDISTGALLASGSADWDAGSEPVAEFWHSMSPSGGPGNTRIAEQMAWS